MKDNTEIKDLLECFFEGETSIEEERVLHVYFKSGEVAPEFRKYAPMFSYFESERSIELDSAIAKKIKPSLNGKGQMAKGKEQMANGNEQMAKRQARIYRMPRYILLRASAVLLVASGATWFYFNNNSVGTNTQPIVNQHKHKAKTIVFDGSEDPKLAFEAVKSALVLTSNKMKKGTEPMSESLEKVREATTILK